MTDLIVGELTVDSVAQCRRILPSLYGTKISMKKECFFGKWWCGGLFIYIYINYIKFWSKGTQRSYIYIKKPSSEVFRLLCPYDAYLCLRVNWVVCEVSNHQYYTSHNNHHRSFLVYLIKLAVKISTTILPVPNECSYNNVCLKFESKL